MSIPNLFSFATSELSQDAIIAWLLTWANPKYKEADAMMHQAGTVFLQSLYAKDTSKLVPQIADLDVLLQWEKIDVLVRITDIDGKKHAIIIEDKVYSSEHTDQLTRYNTAVHDVPQENKLLIYFKTGFQPHQDNVESAGFKHYHATDFLETLKKVTSKNTYLLNEYVQQLTLLATQYQLDEQSYEQFKSQAIETWTMWHWIGAVDQLRVDLKAHAHFNQFAHSPTLSCWFGGQEIQSENLGGKFIGPNIDLHIQFPPSRQKDYTERPFMNWSIRWWMEQTSLQKNSSKIADLRASITNSLLAQFGQLARKTAVREGKKSVQLCALEVKQLGTYDELFNACKDLRDKLNQFYVEQKT